MYLIRVTFIKYRSFVKQYKYYVVLSARSGWKMRKLSVFVPLHCCNGCSNRIVYSSASSLVRVSFDKTAGTIIVLASAFTSASTVLCVVIHDRKLQSTYFKPPGQFRNV